VVHRFYGSGLLRRLWRAAGFAFAAFLLVAFVTLCYTGVAHADEGAVVNALNYVKDAALDLVDKCGNQMRLAAGRIWERAWDWGIQGLRYGLGGYNIGFKIIIEFFQSFAAFSADLPMYWLWRILAEGIYAIYVVVDYVANALPTTSVADYLPSLEISNPILKAFDYFFPLSELVKFFALSSFVFVAYVGLGFFLRWAKVLR
jgi:hypothetical protein